MSEQYPVVERIAQVILARLANVTTANSYQQNCRPMRPTPQTIGIGSDGTIVLSGIESFDALLLQGPVERDDENSVQSGANSTLCLNQDFEILLFVRPSADAGIPVDTTTNIFAADVLKALTTDPDRDWWQFGGLAIGATVGLAQTFDLGLTAGQYAGALVPITVKYRVRENDHYTSATE